MRFTIRDVLWLMVVAGLCMGWRTDRLAMQRQLSASVNYWAQKLADATNEPVHVSTLYGEWLVLPFEDANK